MIYTDLHVHTKYSHGKNTPLQMYEQARNLGLHILGFSEHSPRPAGFNYTHEYRDSLTAHLDTYVREVVSLKSEPKACADGQLCQVLFGMEMDWLEGESSFAEKAAHAYDFDYLLGSVHFIGHWGFDDGKDPWIDASQMQCEQWYEAYFTAWQAMIESGLYSIASHPDLIKIYSKDQFHIWLGKEESQKKIGHALDCLQKKGMAMEVSSAGLRKECKEIYPAPEIMQMAYERGISITFASDAHALSDIANNFSTLASYAASFGFSSYCAFSHGKKMVFSL